MASTYLAIATSMLMTCPFVFGQRAQFVPDCDGDGVADVVAWIHTGEHKGEWQYFSGGKGVPLPDGAGVLPPSGFGQWRRIAGPGPMLTKPTLVVHHASAQGTDMESTIHQSDAPSLRLQGHVSLVLAPRPAAQGYLARLGEDGSLSLFTIDVLRERMVAAGPGLVDFTDVSPAFEADAAGGYRFTNKIEPVEDLDADGLLDVIVFQQRIGDGQHGALATIIGSASGVLADVRIDGTSVGRVSATTNCLDGVTDVAIGADPNRIDTSGRVICYDSLLKSEEDILREDYFDCGEEYGFADALGVVRDLNGDGVAEYVLGLKVCGIGPGKVVCVAGRTHELLWTVGGDKRAPYRFGSSLDYGADIDGDDVGDVLIGAGDASNRSCPGVVSLVSGQDGKLLHSMRFQWSESADY